MDTQTFSVIFIVISLLFAPLNAAQAQDGGPEIIGATMPTAPDARAGALAFLQSNRPADTNYYVITYWQAESETSWLVCLAAVDSPLMSSFYLLSPNTLWIGTIRITLTAPGEYSTEYLSAVPKRAAKMAAPSRNAGGGPTVAFPFRAGSAALYGSEGIHGLTDYGNYGGLAGMVFIDLIGGPSLGPNTMPPSIYASYDGTIDYVCKDDENVAVRTKNQDDDTIFIYSHFIDNGALTLGRTIYRGDFMGNLKSGTFTGHNGTENGEPMPPEHDTCGMVANQDNTIYHLHWGFVPANNKFQAENCILVVATEIWTCSGQSATKEISPGQYITRAGVYTGGGSGEGGIGSQSAPVVNFFDYIIMGIYGLINAVKSYLPQREPNQIMVAILRGLGVSLRIIYTIANSVLNLTILWMTLGAIFALESLRLIFILFRTTKKYIPFV